MPHFLTNILDIKQRLSIEGDDVRADSQEQRFNMYFDDYKEEVENLIKNQFHIDNWTDMLMMIYANYNFLKKIVNLKTIVYKKEAARRYLTGTTTETDDEDGAEIDQFDEDYETIISDSNINTALQQCDLYANINNISVCRIMLNENKDGIEYVPVPAHEISVEQHPENPLRIVGLIHSIKISDTPGDIKRIYFHWTNGQSQTDNPIDEGGEKVGHYRIYDDEGTLVMQPNNPNDLNPYVDKTRKAIIPYVFFRTVQSNEFWNECANRDMFDTTLQVNVNYTHKNNLMKYFGYNQLFVIGDIDTTKMNGKRTDPSAIINVTSKIPGTPADIKGISLIGRLAELDKSIFTQISQSADVQSVSLSADAMTAQRQTAEALTINRKALEETREKLIPIYREAENELAFKTIVIANTPIPNSGLGKNITEDGTFQIDFAELDNTASEKEKAETNTIKIANNTLNPIDIIMEENPDLTEDQATEQWEKNKEINNNNARTLSLATPQQPGQGEEVEPLPEPEPEA